MEQVDQAFQSKEARRQREHEVREAKNRRFHEWLLSSTRFLVLANSGGAVADLAFVGTLLGENKVATWPAAISLLIFVSGIACVGVVILGQLRKAWLEHLDHVPPHRADWFGRITDNFVDWTQDYHAPLIFTSFGLFLFGAILGVFWLIIGSS